MIDFDGLLQTLDEANIALSLDGESLVVKAAKGSLTPDIKAALREHKPALVDALRQGRDLSPQGGNSGSRVPANRIAPETTHLTPEMLPLIDLTEADIAHIVASVPGGVANVQDIYALTPLQDGILFLHQLSDKGDPYLQFARISLANREVMTQYVEAVQHTINRHDILRTAFFSRGLSRSAQVVLRHARVQVTEVELDPTNGPVMDQLVERYHPSHYRIDLTQAPLLSLYVAQDRQSGRWEMLMLLHHLIDDIASLQIMIRDITAFIMGRGQLLPAPQPFRRLIARIRAGASDIQHELFFRQMLGDIDAPTLAFGMANGAVDSASVVERRQNVEPAIVARLRAHARRLGVSMGSLCHLVWGQVMARASDSDTVVFGTILLGRLQAGEGADQIMGPFINTLPIRLDLGNVGVEDSVRLTHKRLAALLDHEHAALSLVQRCSGIAPPTALFNVLFNYRHNQQAEDESVDVSGERDDVEWHGFEERTDYPLTVSVDDFGETLRLNVLAAAPLSAQRIIGYLQQTMKSLADALDSNPATPMHALDILPAGERTRLLVDWNATAASYPANEPVHRLFEQQAARTPDAIAVIDGEAQMSYCRLNQRANQLAQVLVAHGVQPGDFVALLLPRGSALLAATLAILKAGATYVPLDPLAPPERLSWVIEDCSARLLISDAHHALAADIDLPVIDVDSAEVVQASDAAVDVQTAAAAPAYIIYTSGSTGIPKGVLVPHYAINRLVINSGVGVFAPGDRMALAANTAFDASTLEIWAPLLNGGTCVVIDQDTLLTPARLVRTLQHHRVNQMWLTVGLFNQLYSELAPVIAQFTSLFIGGDALDPNIIAQVLRTTPSAKLVNGYGPTETTTFATTYPIHDVAANAASIPIGRPIGNTQLYVLDKHQHPAPLGAIGELYIGGDGVALGYLNRADLTAERFVANPFVADPHARLYRTGDLVRYQDDGNLVFVGRNDQQVKLRGFRIELGEIEARLAEHPHVDNALVLAVDNGSGKRLVAYVVSAGLQASETALQDYLSEHLPDYMVPARIVALAQFPLTANGKVDRKALPAVEFSDTAAYRAPRNAREAVLCELYAELLQHPHIGIDDDFFAMGGHSILATGLIGRIRARLGIELPVRLLFENPTVASLAKQLDEQINVRQALSKVEPRPDPLPVSYGQQLMWVGQNTRGDNSSLNTPIVVSLEGELDQAALTAALYDLVERHETLRTRFGMVDGQPVQVVEPFADVHIDIPYTEVSAEQAHQAVFTAITSVFDLSVDLPFRPSILRVGPQAHILVMLFHHIACDAFSLAPLTRDLTHAYQARLAGYAPQFAPLPVQYADYAVWHRELLGDPNDPNSLFAEQLAYWKTTLAGLPATLALPEDYPRPVKPSYRGEMLPLQIDARLHRRLSALARERNMTLSMVLQAALGIYYTRLGAGEDIPLGAVSAGRSDDALNDLVGCFLTQWVMRVDTSGDPRVNEVLERVRTQALSSYGHQDIPYLKLVGELLPVRSPSHYPLFQTMMILQNAPSETFDIPGLAAQVYPVHSGNAKWDLYFMLYEKYSDEGEPLGMDGILEYAVDLFRRETAERMAAGYLATLEAMVSTPDSPIGQLNVVNHPAPAFEAGAKPRPATRSAPAATADFKPLITLQKGTANSTPLFCVPGAGAGVTDFIPFVQALPGGQPVYGLLPKGIDGVGVPDLSVEAAAARNLAAIRQAGIGETMPVHLLGHSFGGQVAFEMASRLAAQGCRVASLTLIDSEAPLGSKDAAVAPSLAECMREYVESIGFNVETTLDIDESLYARHDIEQVLSTVHQYLHRAGKIPANSSSRLLQGSWQTFYAARQTHYLPAARYHGQVNLIQVRDPWMNPDEDLNRRREDAVGWGRWAEELEIIAGPAQHFTVLKAPHVIELVRWWLQFVHVGADQ
ncbi:non-ribosomal peptide synthetase [Dickeya solani]|uniref:Polyketide synthase/non ribosomal peptide synthetase protein n=2 Tax=Dickeya solani TaxID=1089444 RepID=A0AAV3K6R2_9GAMM|nr:non-ribosomal peptide synthetase [Dickeya solani]ANE74133.1 non-ribosomal peptide synthetase [Dickeya solani IPO 2222]AUC41294.1 Peptide synthetase [Dickeya solani RNS 08.23.3.1.A]AUH10455.1 non-ribosomal peptide synthetase [Dickeya solani D s0432-1]AUH14391.1 non-ribosomal peptide synthetase [Dickeya solani]AYQ48566.1 Dimodular nonribosomal peptide synthase [Dickeya solani]